MSKSTVLASSLAILGGISSASASIVCEDVFPHLSFGIGYSTQELCQAGGGCWESAGCYFPKVPGYEFSSTFRSKGQVKGNLTLIDATGALGPDYKTLAIEVTQQTRDRTHILIQPSEVEAVTAWQVPESIIPRPGGVYNGIDASKIEISKEAPFQMKIKSGDDDIFILSKMIIFQEQYVQVVLSTPSNVVNTYGFGESTRAKQALQKDTPYTMWNTDWWAGGFDASLYGTHPFYIQITENGNAHGVLFLNSNAMEVTLSEDATLGRTIGIQAAGGVIDFYVFSGPSPADVIRQYLEVIGKPAMVPYWSLGFHNCRWGYKSLQHIKDVVANYSAAGIPLETQWADIDYMQNYKDFTTDAVNFPSADFKAYIETLHSQDMRFVPIVDPGIYAVPAKDCEAEYPALIEGLEQNVFIKDLYGKEPYLGQVWPGATYFPDWFAANATSYWAAQFKAFHDLIPYDGIWIDMNEVSNFCNPVGVNQVCALDPTSTCPDGCCLKCETVDPKNKYDFPPYTPHVSQGSLSAKTISMSNIHAGGVLEYNAHSFYGLMESMATQKAVAAATNERSFVLSRSSYVSSGVYTAHWTGDNAARWADLSASIITMNNLALFGIPMTGADICGFAEDTTEELCARWIEVGAFSPFSRNHNTLDAKDQELYRWEQVTKASINVLSMRYRLLPYLYTLMYSATAVGNTVMNALWVNYPKDSEAVKIDAQYMWGNGILFTPVLTQGATAVTGYFPANEIWYPLFEDNEDHNTAAIIDRTVADSEPFVIFHTMLTETNAHVRGGTVVPMQESGMTTTEVKNSPYTLFVALDSKFQSTGELFLDNGVQQTLNAYTVMSYTHTVAEDGHTAVFTSKVATQVGGDALSYVPKTATVGTVKVYGLIRDSQGRVLQSLRTSEVVDFTATVTVHSVVNGKVTSKDHSVKATYVMQHGHVSVDMAELGVHVATEFTVTVNTKEVKV